jgi:Flp pilus assembly protein TadG
MSTFRLQRNTSAVTTEKEGPPATGWPLGGLKSLTRFAGDTAGDVAMLFGLMAMAMFALVGAAVDMGRWLNARDQTIAAMDAAVLAAGRALQTGGSDSQAKREAVAALALKYYQENIKGRLKVESDTVSFEVQSGGTVVAAKGEAYIKTPFMGLAGVKKLPLLNTTGSESSKAVLAVGGNAETSIEISMVLDTSGSMGEYTDSGNAKYIDMRAAATDLVNIVVWDNQGQYTSKVAIVPFSGDVRLPGGLYSAVVPNSPSSICPGNNCGNGHNQPRAQNLASPCVAERTGPNKHTDAAPTGSNMITPEYTSNGSCSQSQSSDELMPLSNNKGNLLSKIAGLEPRGRTAGHIATAWSYYMLSPNWASVLPSNSQPAAYNTPKLKKIAIIMTDGEYNSTHDQYGIEGGNANGSSSSGQSIAICNQMKQSGIDVYTIGFQMSGASQQAVSTLQNCASDASKYYDAEDGEKLKQSFRDIALKISALYLKQ